MKKLLSTLPILSLFIPGASQTGKPDDMAALRKLNATFIHNYVTGNTAAHDSLLHRDFVYISPAGKYTDRKTYLDNWARGFEGCVYWDYRDERISIFGTTALVRSANKYIIRKGGETESGMAIYTDTYVKENGEWKCVQAQIGRVSPEFYPGDETIVRKYDFR